MAQDADVPKAADKGKGKAVDDPKNENAAVNGKKETDEKGGMLCHGDDAPPLTMLTQTTVAGEEELNEEDQQLKGELDMMVERLTVRVELSPSPCKAQTDHC